MCIHIHIFTTLRLLFWRKNAHFSFSLVFSISCKFQQRGSRIPALFYERALKATRKMLQTTHLFVSASWKLVPLGFLDENAISALPGRGGRDRRNVRRIPDNDALAQFRENAYRMQCGWARSATVCGQVYDRGLYRIVTTALQSKWEMRQDY